MSPPTAIPTKEQLVTPVTMTLRELLQREADAYDRGMLAAIEASLDVLRPEPAEVMS